MDLVPIDGGELLEIVKDLQTVSTSNFSGKVDLTNGDVRIGFETETREVQQVLLPKTVTVRFDVLEPAKRPVMADADGNSYRDVVAVEITSDPLIKHRILFDPGHGLEERLISEQFN